ncbi:MAG: phage portal protein, partial [Sarcina sp.]
MLFRRIRAETELTLDDKKLLDWLGIELGDTNVKGLDSLKQSTIYACIRILSDTVSKLPLKVYQNKNGIRKSAEHHVGNLLKLRPNDYMSASDFWKCIEVQRNIFGNAYVYIETDKRGQITGLYPLASDRMKVYIDDKGILNSKNKLWYVFTDKMDNEYKLKPYQILHFKSLTTDGLIGISPIDRLKSIMENGKKAEEYINNFYTNGLQVKGLIQYTGDLNREAEDNFITNFERMSSGIKNAHRVAMLPLGYQFQPISQTLVDAQFLQNTELNIRQIASVFGIKMHQLNDLDRATHSNITEQQREFYIDTLQSILTMYEQELIYKLFLEKELKHGFYIRYNVDAILRS